MPLIQSVKHANAGVSLYPSTVQHWLHVGVQEYISAVPGHVPALIIYGPGDVASFGSCWQALPLFFAPDNQRSLCSSIAGLYDIDTTQTHVNIFQLSRSGHIVRQAGKVVEYVQVATEVFRTIHHSMHESCQWFWDGTLC